MIDWRLPLLALSDMEPCPTYVRLSAPKRTSAVRSMFMGSRPSSRSRSRENRPCGEKVGAAQSQEACQRSSNTSFKAIQRGIYGHGLAADLVSVAGTTRSQRLTSSRLLWDWIDANGKKFGIGRPYRDKDPPHAAPVDGKEYADHHPDSKNLIASSASKLDYKLAARDTRRSQ